MSDPNPSPDDNASAFGKSTNTESKETAGSTIIIAVINIIPRLAWPLLVALLLVFLWTPLNKTVIEAADLIADGGASVEVAGLKISLPKREVPVPPLAVKNILPQLDADMVNFIVANVGGQNILDICYPEAHPKELSDDNSVSNRLRKLGLIAFVQKEQREKGTGKTCGDGSQTSYTSLYDMTRDYLIRIIEAVTFRNAQPL
jgi:hypothetical protein